MILNVNYSLFSLLAETGSHISFREENDDNKRGFLLNFYTLDYGSSIHGVSSKAIGMLIYDSENIADVAFPRRKESLKTVEVDELRIFTSGKFLLFYS